jgi:NADH:ubiquinone oxidoreductase subunit F (NADH-binding)
LTAGNADIARTSEPPGPGELRLIVRDEPLTLAEHAACYGPLPLAFARTVAFVVEVEQSGLTGRGGGAFPAGRKLRAVAEATARSGPIRGAAGSVVVANGAESEPASRKDAVLLSHAPHLVLDGIALCVAAVGAGRAWLCIGQQGRGAAPLLREAIAARAQAGLDPAPVDIEDSADGYLAGQETALISALGGGPALPTYTPPRPADRGVQRRPTLVLNVETLAHIALIGRFGSDWFRSAGTAAAPGSALVTVTGAVARPGVREIPLGTPLGEVLRRSGLPSPAQAVLTGGYFGSWLPLPGALAVPVSEPDLRAAGAALGAGLLAVLPESACGLAETARLTAYLADQNAGQCGPCRNGMPALAEALKWIAFGRPSADAVDWVRQVGRLISGRGACHLPDGAAALTSSALRVFAADLAAHLHSGPCPRAGRPPVLPVPPRPGVARESA